MIPPRKARRPPKASSLEWPPAPPPDRGPAYRRGYRLGQVLVCIFLGILAGLLLLGCGQVWSAALAYFR